MTEKYVSLDCLPFEVIEQILCCDVISYIDICRLSTVSQIFNCIGKGNKLWQIKYSQMWPSLTVLHDANNTDWKSEFRLRYDSKKLVNKKLQEMSVEFYHTDHISTDSFFNFRDLCPYHLLADHILIDELESVIHNSDHHLNLTHKYYAERALRYMRHTLLEGIWESYLVDNPQSLTLLKGACLISQWCQPTKIDCTRGVSTCINEIVKLVFEQVKKVSPKHPAIKKGLPIMMKENGKTLEQSLWTPYECHTILCAINEVMFNTLQFCGNTDYFYSEENSFIDKVLTSRTGIPITLGIVYETVASQLGVACLPVNFPGHFLLKWLEHPHFTGQDAYTFIDVYDKGTFKTSKNYKDLASGYDNVSNSWVEAVTPVKVFTRMCWNLVEVGRQQDGEGGGEGSAILCNALELLSILSPSDMEHKLLLARLYLNLCINMTRVISLLQEISDQDPLSTGIVGYMYRSAITNLETQRIRREVQMVKCQQRENATDVQFAVGMIMRHKQYNYRCVVYGWDSVCTASKDWIKQMGVGNLSYKDKQPFYLVLVDDGTHRYAAQENLEFDCENKTVTHNEVGRYFQSFHGQYYLPNEQKMREYPDDIEARERALNGKRRSEN